MIRQTVRSFGLALAGVLLAGVAWGQQDPVLRQVTSAPANIAAEYFGGEARAVLASKFDLDGATAGVQRPYVGLNVTGTNNITPGNVAEITFTLEGATFAQPATPTNVDQRAAGCGGGVTSNGIKSSVIGGGALGDNSVTFRVEVGGAGLAAAADPGGSAICFWVPDLNVTLATVMAGPPPVRGVNVTASAIKSTASTGTPFPAAVNGPDADTDMNSATPMVPGPITMKTIFQAMNVLNANLGTGGTGQVNIADRTKIAVGGTPDPSVTGAGAAMGLSLGMLTVSLSQTPIWKLDGSGTISTDSLDPTLSGQIKVSVGGQFQSGDMVVAGGGPTALKVAPSGGMAELMPPIEVGSKAIVYVPGGVDVLTPGRFATGAAYLFNDRRNNNAMITPMSTAEIKYLGIEIAGYAYGVVRGGGMESSYGRVTCESSAAGSCAIFVDCTDQDGMNYFGAAPPIPVGETAVWNSDALAGVLDGGWETGRGRCDIHSNGQVSVQHMVRSGQGLINNSTVVGRGLDEGEEAMRKSEIAAVRMVVDNICRSVGDAAGADDRDADTDGAQHTECGLMPPWRTTPPSP